MMRSLGFILTILSFTLLPACVPGMISPVTSTPTPHPIVDYGALVQAFKVVSVAEASDEAIEDPLYAVKERKLNLPRARVQVMEYPTEAEAQAEVARISPDGFRVGNTMVDWVAPPHFYRTSHLIILYVGSDPTTLDLLQQVLGPQFAGAPRDLPAPTIVYAPTVAPPTPAPTVTHDPRTPTMVPPSAAQATIAARATASPFPTGELITRLSGYPAGAGVRRDGLWLVANLPKNTFKAGEGAQAEITLRNEGRETLFVGVGHDLAQLVLLDEQGHEAPPYPWYSAPQPGMPYMASLAPGATITSTITFHAPPAAPASEHHYALWAWTRFSRAAPENNNGPDNVWLRVEAGPIPLLVSKPDPSQQLNARLEADRRGWRVKVTDASGQAPSAPMWGIIEAATYSSSFGSLLKENTAGEWSGTWPDDKEGNQIVVRTWVSATGYAGAVASVVVPGNRSGQTLFDAQPLLRRGFPSLDAARVVVNLPLATPRQLPPGTTLDRAEVEDSTYDGYRRTFVYQVYHSRENQWLELTQMIWTQRFESAGWGLARYDPEAEQVNVSRTTGYLVKEFDWWILDWRAGKVGFELHAPVGMISREALLGVATSVQP